MVHMRGAWFHAACLVVTWCSALGGVAAQAAKEDAEDADELSAADNTTSTEARVAASESADAPKSSPPVVAPALPAPPSPFVFSFRGTVALTLFAQDTPVITGNGVGALAGPLPALGDSWHSGGDIRQSRFSLNVRGPELLGAIPLASIELEMAGGNQIYTVGAPPAVGTVRDAAGNPIGTAVTPGFTRWRSW